MDHSANHPPASPPPRPETTGTEFDASGTPPEPVRSDDHAGTPRQMGVILPISEYRDRHYTPHPVRSTFRALEAS